MKLSDCNTVQKLIRSRVSIQDAIRQLDYLLKNLTENRPDPGGVPGVLSHGYSCDLMVHGDPVVKMSNCYVAVEVAEAVRDVLSKKLNEVDVALKSYGVDVDTDEEG